MKSTELVDNDVDLAGRFNDIWLFQEVLSGEPGMLRTEFSDTLKSRHFGKSHLASRSNNVLAFSYFIVIIRCEF